MVEAKRPEAESEVDARLVTELVGTQHPDLPTRALRQPHAYAPEQFGLTAEAIRSPFAGCIYTSQVRLE